MGAASLPLMAGAHSVLLLCMESGCAGASRDTAAAMSHANVEVVRGVRIALPPISEGASRRRSLDEHVRVRFPSLFRRLGDAFMRLPPGSRLRRSILAHLVGRAYAAANRRDFELVLVGWDPGSEYRPSSDLLPPDLETVFHGHEGYLQLWRYWLDAFEDIRWDPEEILDFGDMFLVTTQQKGHGSGSGLAVSERVFQLFTLRHGLVVRQEDFLDRSKALEAVEPPE
jgi:ketosteroid isomerase-like protein